MVKCKNCRRVVMQLHRWSGTLILTSLLWLSWTNLAVANESLAHQRHVLSRLSFGTTSREIVQIEKNGLEAYIQSQLKPETIEESSTLENYLAKLESLKQDPMKQQKLQASLFRELGKSNLTPQQLRQKRLENRTLRNQAQNQAVNAHVARAINSNRQLQEVMVDFWFNHFSVNIQKRAVRFWINDYENQIRTHALGNFADLLLATAQHPAMLMYLDNDTNTDPQSRAGKKRQLGLNENYARELMELHTLGVDGGYSQDDVISLAKILTGWGLDHENKNKGSQNGFYFNPNRHSPSSKTFLGYEIAGNGVEEGKQAIQILANHPATADFISYKLAQYFVADQPPESLVQRLSKQFSNSGGNIKIVLDTLIHSPEFNDPQYYGQKFKTPYQYIISLVRMGEIKQPEINRVQGMIKQLSMPVYQCQTPDGYDNTKSTWLNPQAILQRTSFATAIANKLLNRQSSITVERLEKNIGEISVDTRKVIEQASPRLHTALIMGSPEAMYQ